MQAFWYISNSSPSLHDYDVKIPNFTFVEDVKAGQRLFFFSGASIQSFRIFQKEMPTFDELNEMEYYNTGISAIKFEATRFYFSSDFFDSQPLP